MEAGSGAAGAREKVAGELPGSSLMRCLGMFRNLEGGEVMAALPGKR